MRNSLFIFSYRAPANANNDAQKSGAQLNTLSGLLKHVTLAGVDIGDEYLSQFKASLSDTLDVVPAAQDHADRIANDFSKFDGNPGNQ